MKKTKHQWEPTEKQGQAFECLQCGRGVSFVNDQDWNKTLHGTCKTTESR